MAINEAKMKIVINNYFKDECNVDMSIREAFEKGFRIGVKKGEALNPKIIRCKDCKYYKKDHGWSCIEYTVCAISPIRNVIRKPDDFCSRAERRIDD